MTRPRRPLGDLVTIVGGGTPSRKVQSYWGGQIPWASIKDLRGFELNSTKESITDAALESSASRVVPAGTVIVGTRMSIGSPCINSVPVAINQDLKALTPRDDLDPRYLLWFLHSCERQLQSQASGATVKGIKLEHLRDLLVPDLDLSEQRRIAGILDRANTIRRMRREAIALSEELVLSTFLELFGDPVRVGSAGRKTTRLDEVATLSRGKFSVRPRNDPRYFGGRYPYFQTGEIGAAKGYLGAGSQSLNAKGAAVSRAFGPGTVVIAIVGATIGETAILSAEMYCPDSVIGVQPGPEVTAEFLEVSLRFWKPVFRAQAPETARANINLKVLGRVPVVLPAAAKLKAFTRLYKSVYRSLRRGQDDSEALLQSLVQRAFRGEL